MSHAQPHATSTPTNEARKVTAASTSVFASMNIARRGFTVSDVMMDWLEYSLVMTMTPRMPTMSMPSVAPVLTVVHTSSMPTGMASCDAMKLRSQPIIRLLTAKNATHSTSST